MTAGGNRFNGCECDSQLNDDDFHVNTNNGYCTVSVIDSLTVVVTNNALSIEVEVYRTPEDDTPIESTLYLKEERQEDDDYGF